MRGRRSIWPWLVFVVAAVAGQTVLAAEPGMYREGRSGKAELKIINGLPVLVVRGTPEEMGRQQAALLGTAAKELIDYPKDLLRLIRQEGQWPRVVAAGLAMTPYFPPSHLAELDAFARAAGIDRRELIGVNTMVDTYRGGFGCSAMIVGPKRSKTGGVLFGRNLDFFTLGKLHKFSLVIVYRSHEKHAFASVAFPGFFGCLSGMNDAGLAVAVHEVYSSRDRSPLAGVKGTPYALCVRRLLEECTTIEEAERLLRATKRTTKLNLSICDRRGGGVLEMTPKTVVLRREVDGLCFCTNHFRSDALATLKMCRRYDKLAESREARQIDLAYVARKLHEVNQGSLTLQTMVFEPDALRLHLAIGKCPSSALPLKKLELRPLFGGSGARRVE